jgi:hypothetical protein
MRQKVVPVLRSVETHRPLVRIEHNVVVCPYKLTSERHHCAASACVALDRGDGDFVSLGENSLDNIVDSINVSPRLFVGISRGLDSVKVDTVRPSRKASSQDYNLHV